MHSSIKRVIKQSSVSSNIPMLTNTNNTVALSLNTHTNNPPVFSNSSQRFLYYHYSYSPNLSNQRILTSANRLGNLNNNKAELTPQQQIIERRKSYRTRGSLVIKFF